MLAQETGTYRERPVSPALRSHFSHVWVHCLAETQSDPIVIVPDGAVDLQWIRGRWRIAGPDQTPLAERIEAGSVVIGFRFQPASASPWLRTSLSELCNARIWLDDIDANLVRRLEPAEDAGSVDDLIAMLEHTLARQITSVAQPESDMRLAHRLLAAGPPPGRHVVPWLMAELGLSERTLRRRFDAIFGYGPKTLDRILRFQRYLEFARTQHREPAAGLAAAAGYADQAHLVRECRRLTLRTPGRIRVNPTIEWGAQTEIP